MTISHNKVVTLTYKLSDHTTGEHIEETTPETALTFLYGVGGMIPEFEEKLAGKAAGEHFDFHILAANAYGEQDPQHIVCFRLIFSTTKMAASTTRCSK